VAQKTGDGYCTSPINLAGKASCVLALYVTAPADINFALCHGASCTAPGILLKVSYSIPMIASGFYATTSATFPLVVTSSDNGTSWAYSLFNGSPPLPTDFGTIGFINGSSCMSSTCIVAGQYTNNIALSQIEP
jgi:hypothetical protein